MVADPYKRVSGIYDSIFASINKGLQGICLSLIPPKAGQTVLDVGCGTGQFLQKYGQGGSEIYGIDTSPSMLEQAEKRLGDGANLYLGDASGLPYEDGMFDLVMTSLVLHELDQKLQFAILKEMARVVEQNGRLMIVDFHPGTRPSFKGVYRKIFIVISEIIAGRAHYRNYRKFLARGGLPALAGEARLAIEQQKIVAGGNIGIFILQPIAGQ